MDLDIGTIGALVGIGGTLMGANAFLMNVIVDRACMKITISLTALMHSDFVTRKEYEAHIERCPHMENR
jgi:hypothetical protein